MPSISDIPADYRQTDRKLDFILWVVRQPVSYDVRRELAYLWTQATGRNLEGEDWDFLRRNSQA